MSNIFKRVESNKFVLITENSNVPHTTKMLSFTWKAMCKYKVDESSLKKEGKLFVAKFAKFLKESGLEKINGQIKPIREVVIDSTNKGDCIIFPPRIELPYLYIVIPSSDTTGVAEITELDDISKVIEFFKQVTVDSEFFRYVITSESPKIVISNGNSK